VQNRNNKLLRSRLQSQASKKYAVHENQLTADEQLTRLEEEIRKLKIEFDIYFNGAAKRPPYDTKSRVETVLKRLGDDRSLTFAQRYRFNSLTARYNIFRDFWRRTMQDREEGRDPVSAARVKVKQRSGDASEPMSYLCLDANKEVDIVKSLYDSLLEAKQRCGESTTDFSFPRFHRLIASKADGLKKRVGCDKVRFSISVESGHVSFKAKPE
jgi:hypothetical protein